MFPLNPWRTQVLVCGQIKNIENWKFSQTTGNETSTVLRQEEAIVRRPLTYLVYPTRTSPHSINTPDASDAEDYDDDGDDDDIPDPDPGSREEVQTLAPSLEVAAGTTAPPQHHRQEFPRLDTGARSVEYTLRHPRRRRHRRATQVVPAMRRSEKCKIDGECGVGIRYDLTKFSSKQSRIAMFLPNLREKCMVDKITCL